MKNKIQILMVHGGMTFKNDKGYLDYLRSREVKLDKKPKWSEEYIKNSLGKDFQIIKPNFPLKENAKYRDWKIWFERYIPLLKNNCILIGNSLGGIFLAKYLSENVFPKKILSTYLVGAPYDNTCIGEDLVGGFKLKSDLTLLEKNSGNLYLMFSEDDDVVPVSHADKYRSKLKKSQFFIYKNKKGHFKVAKFPEIIKMIKRDVQAA